MLKSDTFWERMLGLISYISISFQSLLVLVVIDYDETSECAFGLF